MYNRSNIKKHSFIRIRNPYAISARFRNSAGAMKGGKKRLHKDDRRQGVKLTRIELANY